MIWYIDILYIYIYYISYFDILIYIIIDNEIYIANDI